jgi:hypothetical protein
MRGLLYELRKNYKEALLNYQYALELNPDYALAREGAERMSKK